ncbi:hypothetical protein HH219_21470 [Pseudoalteromonas sp. NEC-BIFX-2020_015]|uniref:hypothetical protein n=1 Tax=Pseudoalteromonas sp. NEC-BIFX-2020_015 TaxID=2729544 RepID=UPI00146153EC|nr:hypothetical protein [Pseudoalteromonas sp. NEC-BIFX-2020_015]NMR28056.1 hypothetical protein [Pseudoalteromonas sp. NEC-BIFX-2020_015]
MKLNHTYQNVIVNEVHVKRVGSEFEITFSFNDEAENLNVVLKGIRDTDNISDLLEADRLWVEENDTNQTEFGNFTLGISSECYSEIFFDSMC